VFLYKSLPFIGFRTCPKTKLVKKSERHKKTVFFIP